MSDDAKRYTLRVDIEAVNINNDCSRPVDQVLLAESNEPKEIERQFDEIELNVTGAWERRSDFGYGKARIIEYTVFISTSDELFEAGEAAAAGLEFVEADLGQYTSLARAKKFMREIVKKYGAK